MILDGLRGCVRIRHEAHLILQDTDRISFNVRSGTDGFTQVRRRLRRSAP